MTTTTSRGTIAALVVAALLLGAVFGFMSGKSYARDQCRDLAHLTNPAHVPNYVTREGWETTPYLDVLTARSKCHAG